MEYTLHRALSLVKTTEKRFNELEDERGLFFVKVVDSNTSNDEIKELETLIRSKYNYYKDLLDTLFKVKLAISKVNGGYKSNAEVTFKVQGEQYTISQILVIKSLLEYKKQFLKAIKDNCILAERELSRRTEALQDKLAQISSNTFDKEYSKAFLDNCKPKLIDPLKINKILFSYEESLSNLEIECESALAMANSLTSISC